MSSLVVRAWMAHRKKLILLFCGFHAVVALIAQPMAVNWRKGPKPGRNTPWAWTIRFVGLRESLMRKPAFAPIAWYRRHSGLVVSGWLFVRTSKTYAVYSVEAVTGWKGESENRTPIYAPEPLFTSCSGPWSECKMAARQPQSPTLQLYASLQYRTWSTHQKNAERSPFAKLAERGRDRYLAKTGAAPVEIHVVERKWKIEPRFLPIDETPEIKVVWRQR